MPATYIQKCFTCRERISYHAFHLQVFLQKGGVLDEWVDEIWENPIFVIECCRCYGNRNTAEWLKKNIANRPYKCKKCGHGIEWDYELCYTCFVEKKAKERL